MVIVAVIAFLAAGFVSMPASAQAPAAVPSVRAAQATYVVGRDQAASLQAKDMPEACAGQPVTASFFVRNGAEPMQVSAFRDSPTASAVVPATGAVEAQLALPRSLSEPVRVWPGLSGSCLKQPVIDESLGIELAVFDPAANPAGTSSIVVSADGLASVANRPDGLSIGAVVRSISVFADAKPCTTVSVDPKLTGHEAVVMKLGASGQPSECSRAGAAITFTNGDGKSSSRR
jgi:hypothetical protein